MQDVKELPEIEELKSSESRSCISLCRPYGRFVDKRKEKGRGPVMSTQTHQSGELYMRPLTPEEDAARGMLTGVVADEETLKEKFKIKEREVHVLPKVLQWLRQKNPWLSAYESSLAKVEECAQFCETLAREGCRLPNLASLKTVDDSSVIDTLGDERVAVLLPLDDFGAMRNSYRHLRTAAHVIMQARGDPEY